MSFEYDKIKEYYDDDYWNAPGVKSGYANMTAAIGGDWHKQACGWFDSVIPVKDKTLFDAGCGLGHFMVAFQTLGADVFGCDISNYSAKSMLTRFPNKFQQTTLESMSGVPKNAFDIVFCSSTMEHVPQGHVEPAFQNLISITRPGGIIYIEIDCTPNDKKPVPEASHVNIRPWASWLREIDRLVYSWIPQYDLIRGLKNQRGFPGFPHPDWEFFVLKRF